VATPNSRNNYLLFLTFHAQTTGTPVVIGLSSNDSVLKWIRKEYHENLIFTENLKNKSFLIISKK
jgi:hypothetical protein